MLLGSETFSLPDILMQINTYSSSFTQIALLQKPCKELVKQVYNQLFFKRALDSSSLLLSQSDIFVEQRGSSCAKI